MQLMPPHDEKPRDDEKPGESCLASGFPLATLPGVGVE